ncbi:hypothetical protein TI39_contig4305g00001 [Zymoseptoria brevis]|uniref:Heterokaryon incompatibility domain-containing protein n=1 Tax=Zymoseptoria brevis TaxID=1047168 RepID=A0A0F4G936_9PEZI|nr:hypothetical protein TI39_contig4305g00001 [Zymoseptoria brevis]
MRRHSPHYPTLWGQPDPNCHIEVNSASLRITKNLLRFLMQVRQLFQYASRCFWIDAVCVDQSNLDERGQQVSLMPSIYSSAALVVLWLGPEYESSDLAMHAFTRNSSTIPTQSTHSGKLWRKGEGAAIRALCERRYWTRLWVLQELTLADNKIEIMCGDKQTQWTAFTAFTLHVRPPPFRARNETNYACEGLRKSPGKAMTIQILQTSNDALLYDQILAARHLNCWDPRDKFYGVLGISGGTFSGAIRADYDISLVRLVHKVLQQELAERPPTELDEIVQRAQRLGDVLDVPVGDILSTAELPPPVMKGHALNHKQTGIDLLWAFRLKL